MKITLESTTKIVTVDGVPCRVWEGRSEGGVEVFAMITRIGVNDEHACIEQFERELERVAPPSVEIAAFPGRIVL